MRKQLLIAGAVLALTLSTAFTSLAAEWKQDGVGWWYQEDNGTYPANQWKWIGDKCYYFGADGYMLSNTVTPDGCYVDASGAWVTDPQILGNIYGAVGKDGYDDLVKKWVNGEFDDEADLRLFADSWFADSPVREQLVQTILAMPQNGGSDTSEFDEAYQYEIDEEELEEAINDLYENESEGFAKKKKAVIRYVEAIGINSEGFIIEHKNGVYSVKEIFEKSGDESDEYISELRGAIMHYIMGFKGIDGRSPAEKIIDVGLLY